MNPDPDPIPASFVAQVTISDGAIVTQSRSVVIELFNNPPFCQTFNGIATENRAHFNRLVCESDQKSDKKRDQK
jgi:hypothetical protein